ncbi:hypothetical protein PENSPDRAFT_749646 [Peniophora sp. CONT]|nr:hypothetical protein PENSPDRAFT_749646 [Peniophora sp. CONT]
MVTSKFALAETTSSSKADDVTTSDIFARLWSDAQNKFKQQVGVELTKHPIARDLEACTTAEDICVVFERQLRVFVAFRGSASTWGKLRNTYLKPTVEIILMLSNALGEAASVLPAIPGGKAIFVVLGSLLRATQGVTERYDSLMGLFEEINLFLDSLAVRTRKHSSWGHASRNISSLILAHLFDVFVLAIELLPSTSTTGIWRMFSLTKNKDMQSALQRLRALTALEVRALASETRVDTAEALALSSKLMEELHAMKLAQTHDTLSLQILEQSLASLAETQKRGMDQASDERQRIVHAQEDAKEAAMLSRLDPVDRADISAQARHGCLPGTRVEILKELRTWAGDSAAPPVYWLNGMAGTGKSAIARSLCWSLRSDNLLGGSFFCSRGGSADQMDVKRILPTLVHGIAARDYRFRNALIARLALYGSEPRPSTWNVTLQIVRLLEEPFSDILNPDVHPLPLVLVIDALDETDSHTIRDFLSVFIARVAHVPIKVFLTSRPERGIRLELRSVETVTRLHDIEQDIVEADMFLYIKSRLVCMCDDAFPPGWPSQRDILALTRLADKLFIYAFTALEYLSEDPIERLPKLTGHSVTAGQPLYGPLDAIYSLIISSAIDPRKYDADDIALTRKVLGVILSIGEPLPVYALSSLLGVTPNRLRSSLNNLHAVINVPDSDEHGTLSTFHASFSDFLSSPGRAPREMQDITVNGQYDIAAASISLFQSDKLRFNVTNASTSYLSNCHQDLAPVDLSLRYACLYWSYDLFNCSLDDLGFARDLWRSLEHVFVGPKFLFWTEVIGALDISLADACVILSRAIRRSRQLELSDLRDFLEEALAFLKRFYGMSTRSACRISTYPPSLL